MDSIIIDENNMTVYLDNPDTIIDLGATAKGYAVELVVNELKDMGYENLVLSGGGDVKAIGKPMESGRDKWGVGIQNPDVLLDDGTGSNVIDTLYVNDLSIVTSGDYQRFFEVDGQRYHHIIDKDTMGPIRLYKSITVTHPDAGLADFLATAIYVTDYEEGRELIESIEGAECMWITADGELYYTDGLKSMSKNHGASNN